MEGGLPSCSSTMGNSKCPAATHSRMRQFFLFDLLTFGFASALVMFLVAFAIPRRDVGDRAALAGQMYLALCLSVVLLSAALWCGMWALWAGVLAVYPPEYAWLDVLAPLVVSSTVMGMAFSKLISRPLLLFPGWPALHKAAALEPMWVAPLKAVTLWQRTLLQLGVLRRQFVRRWMNPVWRWARPFWELLTPVWGRLHLVWLRQGRAWRWLRLAPQEVQPLEDVHID